MGREHTPRPGVTWRQHPIQREVLTNDDGQADTRMDGLNEPAEPRLNREQRRALERAKRRKDGRQ